METPNTLTVISELPMASAHRRVSKELLTSNLLIILQPGIHAPWTQIIIGKFINKMMKPLNMIQKNLTKQSWLVVPKFLNWR